MKRDSGEVFSLLKSFYFKENPFLLLIFSFLDFPLKLSTFCVEINEKRKTRRAERRERGEGEIGNSRIYGTRVIFFGYELSSRQNPSRSTVRLTKQKRPRNEAESMRTVLIRLIKIRPSRNLYFSNLYRPQDLKSFPL